MSFVVVGLGSNLGDKEAALRDAVVFLEKKNILKFPLLSPIYESDALLPPGAPDDWDIPYYNMAVSGTTELAPKDLLAAVKSAEESLGREKKKDVWAPRKIDIDILVYDDLVYEDEALCIPHKHLANRAFALLPLLDICPDWTFPKGTPHAGKKAQDITAAYPSPLPFNTRKIKTLVIQP